MDARAGVGAGLAAIAVAACGGHPPRACAPRVLARGTLAYDAVATADAVVALELETRFAVVVHDAATGAVRATIDLGGPSPDLTALAVVDRAAYVGGRDQAVRAIDLDRGAVTATWPVGADVTALAATADYVAIGDATGTLCLRRRADGALLQCVADAAGPAGAAPGATPGATPGAIDHLAIAGDRLRAGARAYALPSLVAVAEAPPAGEPPFRPPVRFGGAIRSVRPGPDGTAIAAWVHDLDDPSVVLVPRNSCAP